MERSKASFNFESELWVEFRQKCIAGKREYTSVLEELMREWLLKSGKERDKKPKKEI